MRNEILPTMRYKTKIDKGGLYYFPSYEITKEYFIDPFTEDNRHLKDECTLEIMKIFEESYCC